MTSECRLRPTDIRDGSDIGNSLVFTFPNTLRIDYFNLSSAIKRIGK